MGGASASLVRYVRGYALNHAAGSRISSREFRFLAADKFLAAGKFSVVALMRKLQLLAQL